MVKQTMTVTLSSSVKRHCISDSGTKLTQRIEIQKLHYTAMCHRAALARDGPGCNCKYASQIGPKSKHVRAWATYLSNKFPRGVTKEQNYTCVTSTFLVLMHRMPLYSKFICIFKISFFNYHNIDFSRKATRRLYMYGVWRRLV